MHGPDLSKVDTEREDWPLEVTGRTTQDNKGDKSGANADAFCSLCRGRTPISRKLAAQFQVC